MRSILIFCSLFFFTATSVLASVGEVEFTAIGSPKLLKITGSSKELQEKSGVYSVDLNTLDTGIGMRNTHMKERYLETAKYPQAEFALKHIADFKPGAKVAAGNYPFDGEFSLHGKKQIVHGTVELSPTSDGKLTAKVDFPVSLDDYGIQQPNFAGITVEKKIDVHVRLDAVDAVLK